MSLEQANPFNVSLHRATAIVHNKVSARQIQQNNSNRQPQNNNNNNNIEKKGDDTKTEQVGLHVGNSVEYYKEPSKEEHHINIEAKLTRSEDQVGMAPASNPDEDTTLTAKQLWALIDPNYLDIDQANDVSLPVKGGYGFILVANDVDLEE